MGARVSGKFFRKRKDLLARRAAEERCAQLRSRQFKLAEELYSLAANIDDPARALELYRDVVKTNPQSVAARINLGTLLSRLKRWVEARDCYLEATILDPKSALAWFDLGIAYEETREPAKAMAAYRNVLHAAPFYADAHYNLASMYGKNGELRKALKHWKMYAKLDLIGEWHDRAMSQVKLILATERLQIVFRNPSQR